MAYHYAYMTHVAEVREPKSYTEANKDANWCAAMEEEMHETWDLVDALKGVKPIACRWVYKIKYNTEGSVNRYKARLVVKDYTQKHDIDYDERLASVAKMMTVRVLLAVAAAKGWHLHQMDVKNAFCKASLRNRCTWYNPLDFTSKRTLGNMPIEEVPLRTKASPACLERCRAFRLRIVA